MGFRERLQSMKETFAANAGRAAAAAVPPGQYSATCSLVEIAESASGRLQIHREHIITEGGPYQGESIHDYLQIETEVGPRFIKQWLEVLEFDFPTDPADLEEIAVAITDQSPSVMIRVVQRGDFTNVRVLRRLGESAEDVEDTTEDVEPEHERPRQRRAPTAADPDLVALRVFATEQDIDVAKFPTKEALITEIQGYVWDRDLLQSDELTLLQRYGAEFQEPKPKPEPEPKPKPKPKPQPATTRKR